MLIDTHAHLHVKEFDHDRAEVIKRALEANVDFIAVGFEPDGNESAARLAQEYNTFWTAGIHPHHADLATDENLQKIRNLSKSDFGSTLVALGEMGLDYYKNFQPPGRVTARLPINAPKAQPYELQHEALRKQLVLSRELKLPVIIHCRNAFSETLELLNEEKITEAVFHCFTGTLDEAEECWKRGYYTSFTGICTYSKAENIRAAIAKAPLSRIMIETDCPFLPPQSHRGKRNEPAYLRETFKKISEIKEIPEQELEKIFYENTFRFFHILKWP